MATLHVPEAERRQLTVLFCDLVDSTRLARQFDPEDWRDIVQAYQQACAEVIQSFDGYIAQYLGDGLLVYFGYPLAHEDDAQRAGLVGLGILDAMWILNARLEQERGVRLAVRVGVHTGPVVVGAMGGGERQEQLALGDTPNLAARLQGLATPDTVVVSAATLGLIEGFFTYQTLGEHALKGVEEPLWIYQLLAKSGAQTRLDAVTPRGLTPLVGRQQEVGLLLERWVQSTEGHGQVVLLSGEAGIGKSRLVEVLRERVGREGTTWLTFRCSPYHMNSALYPVITHLQRVLRLRPEETPAEQLERLERALQTTRLPLEEAVPLLAALLSVPLAERYPPLDWSPQKQKEKTYEALVAWLVAEAERQPVLAVWEDLHWADPSTLEWLGLVLDQTPTAPLYTLLTYRPEFPPPWAPRSYLTQLTLSRLTRPQVEEMLQRLTGGKRLPAEVVRQMVAKTDGVPLFVEELTKTVLESGGLQEQEDHYTWRGLGQLVQAEVLYQRGVPPLATYTFKHALLQEAAYQSLLRSTRQQVHQRTAQVLAEQFPQTAETQPELLAQHYMEAGLAEEALGYWQRAGERSSVRSAYVEAVAHCTKGLEVLHTLPDTPGRARHELAMQLLLGRALLVTKGAGAPERGQTLARARELCHQVGDTPQLFGVLQGLASFHQQRGEYQTARELQEQLLPLTQDPTLRMRAHSNAGMTLFYLGELTLAQAHLEQALGLSAPQSDRSLTIRSGQDSMVLCLCYTSLILWILGYPDQALTRNQEMLTYAQALSHAFDLARALINLALLHRYRREGAAVQEHAEAALAIATELGFEQTLTYATLNRGWALAAQGQREAGMAQIRQGLAAMQPMGSRVALSEFLALLAEAYGQSGQSEAGLRLLTEALAHVDTTGERHFEAEVYRIKGELLLQQAIPDMPQAEACFQQALAIARRQQAKSWELRAALSLSRLWQRQGLRDEARELLAPIYGWFTQGFDTADLQEAKALLEELA